MMVLVCRWPEGIRVPRTILANAPFYHIRNLHIPQVLLLQITFSKAICTMILVCRWPEDIRVPRTILANVSYHIQNLHIPQILLLQIAFSKAICTMILACR